MILIEREREIDELRAAITEVTEGSGRACAVTGEPGAGKTTLVDEVRGKASDLRSLLGVCDALSTPRPLGPFRDIAGEIGLPLTGLGESSSAFAELCEGIFDAVRAEPTILVIEDAQWSDEASIDVIRFLLRRLEVSSTLLVVTYRDSEIDPGHPLRPLLADLARLPYASTLALEPLSVAAVGEVLAGTDLDPGEVHELTGGNPFFVAEIARHGGTGLPPSVRDVVLANTSALDDGDIEVLQLFAAAPDGLDDGLLPALEIDLPTLRRLDATGLLTRTRRGVAFRHELARLAVETSIPAGGAAQLHARILDALERVGTDDHAALTHHAVESRDPARIGRFARGAADEAIRAGSHTEAVAFLQLVIEHHDGSPSERARLLQRLSDEQYMTNQLGAAIESAAAAQRLWGQVGDPVGEAWAFDQWATYEYYAGHRRAAEARVDRAAVVARDGEATLSFGRARATQAYLAFRRAEFEFAAACQRDAREVADEVADDALRIRAKIIDRVSAVARGDPHARAAVLTAVDEAISLSLDDIASMGMSNLVCFDVEQCRLHAADELLARSLPFTVEREIKVCNVWQRGVRARLHLMRGRWEAALEDALPLIEDDVLPLARLAPHLVTGLVELRRSGDDRGHFDAAWRLAEVIDEPAASLTVLAALSERAWLNGTVDARVGEAHEGLRGSEIASGLGWAAGNLAVWLRRSGRSVGRTDDIEDPYARSLAGEASAAATRWREIGAPFEAALADFDGDDTTLRTAAIEALDGLGATATADRCRLELRSRGITRLPARPRASTRANPAGLTNRQLEVARLVADGLTNAELAERLYISAKTADHHVSAVLAKLGLSSRREIAGLADTLG